jgi:hypothetical protein
VRRLPNSFPPHLRGTLRPKPWGSAPNSALAVRQRPGMINPSPAPASSVLGLQDVKRLSRHKRKRKIPLSHLFHGPLDTLPAMTSSPLLNERKTTKRSIQGVGGEGKTVMTFIIGSVVQSLDRLDQLRRQEAWPSPHTRRARSSSSDDSSHIHWPGASAGGNAKPPTAIRCKASTRLPVAAIIRLTK